MEISTNKLNCKINSTNFRKNFTISLTDKKKKKFKVAIDETASSPLYYVIDKKKICLSSNIDKLPKTSLNIKAINKYLNYGLIPAPDTIYKNIYKLESGAHSFDFNRKIFIKNKEKKSNKVSLKKSLDKIPSNIKNYLNDKNLAVLITGGLDSSFLAALTKEIKPTLFFAAIEDNKILNYNLISIKKCKDLAKNLNLPFEIINIGKKDFLKNAKETIKLMDEPIKDYDLLAVYSFFEKISKKLPSSFMISGIGANELFNLPKKYLQLYLNKKIPTEIRIHKKIAEKFGLGFYPPYLSDQLINFSLNTPLKLRKNKNSFKKEIIKTGILPDKYIMQPSQHSEIPDNFLKLLENISVPFDNKRLKKYISSNIIKIIEEKNDILLPLWIKEKYLKTKKTK